jgi:mycothiol system anti-sigma-R factor
VTGFGPGGLDCGQVIADVFVYLDDETDSDARARIREHLDGCAPCLRQFGLEQDVIALVARCCGGDVAPDTLRDGIRTRLQQVTISTSYVEFRSE